MGRGHEGVPTEDGEVYARVGRVAETDQDVIVADEFEAAQRGLDFAGW